MSRCVQKILSNIDFKSIKSINFDKAGYTEWNSFGGKVFDQKTVYIKDAGNIHPKMDGRVFKCDTLIVDQCNKNFVYYWIHSYYFINVKNIFLFSHPAEPAFFRRWEGKSNIFLSENNLIYKNRWAAKMDNVTVIDNNIKQQILDKIDKI